MTLFQLDVPAEVLDDLHRRLAATVLPVQTPWRRLVSRDATAGAGRALERQVNP